jgi:hypothetical protein
VRPLGSGGMGHVWLARDERTGLDVALKMVGREGRVAERAEREARAAAALRHPRCQRIYALARDSSHVYIAYEYVPGRTMRQALSAGELGDREALEVAAQVLEALDHAHGRGIIHRDVKPSNVLLGEGDATDVRLLDFGLAQMAEFETLTAIGDVPGTLTYVSPERLAGETATPAADIWAVGVMLWEALAGHHPFRSSSAEGTTRLIRAGAPPIESVRSDLPPGVRSALTRALALDPAQRPSASALADELRAEPRRRQRQRRSEAAAHAAPAVALEARRALGPLAETGLPAAAAAAWTGWVAWTLPFYPAGWPLGLTVAAGVLGLGFARLAFPFALAVSLFPLANISIGLAVLFGLLAALWTALTWSDPRGNAAAAAGPLLGAISSLTLIPVAAQLARGPLRRALQAAAGVLAAATVAGIDGRRLPFSGAHASIRLAIASDKSPLKVATTIARALAAQPQLLEEAGALALAAILLPYLRGRGLLAAAAGGCSLLVVTALLAPAASLLPFAAAALVTGALLALAPARPAPPR